MEIHFVSTLTPEDEDRFAPALLSAVATLLDQFSLAYTLRIQTSGSKVFHFHSPATEFDATQPQPRRTLPSSRWESAAPVTGTRD